MVVPHVPSVEMACEAVEVELVFEEVVEEDLTVLEVDFDDVVEVVLSEEVVEVVLTEDVLDLTVVEEVFTELVELLVEVQFPDAGWHPAPQYLKNSLAQLHNGRFRSFKLLVLFPLK
jgi:hypothetical protein